MFVSKQNPRMIIFISDIETSDFNLDIIPNADDFYLDENINMLNAEYKSVKQINKEFNTCVGQMIHVSDYRIRDNCSICQTSMRGNKSLSKIISCNHVFHKECIENMITYNLESNNDIKCPLCRHKFELLKI